jgi:hypothetical protein
MADAKLIKLFSGIAVTVQLSVYALTIAQIQIR